MLELVAQAVRSAPAPCRSDKGQLSSPLLPLVAAVHPAKQRVEPAARRLPDRARRGAGVLTNLILGVELLRLAQRRLGSRGDLLAHRVLLLEGPRPRPARLRVLPCELGHLCRAGLGLGLGIGLCRG